jgi:hypothetical protein
VEFGTSVRRPRSSRLPGRLREADRQIGRLT